MGIPWLDQPLSLAWHPPNECTLNDTAQCEYQLGYWRNWNIADYHYGLPTVALFLAVIAIFMIVNITDGYLPATVSQSTNVRRVKGVWRFLSYRTFRIHSLDSNSAPIGILLLAAAGALYFVCMTLIPQPYYWPNTTSMDYGDQPPLATRSGWLSIACLPFVFATAGKSNLITGVTGVSHEKLQVFHRWISYAFFVTALVHTFPFIIYHISIGDMVEQWRTQIYYWTGTVAIIAQAWLTFASFGRLREKAYEFFKYSHFAAALIFMIFLFFHCDGEFSSWDYFVATGVLFSVSWLRRHARILFEHGISHIAHLHLESNGFVKVTVPTQATWRVAQHFFLRILARDLQAFTAHPFSACSLPELADVYEVKASELVFYIRPRGGMTARLARHSSRQVRMLLDGPYGGIDMRKFDTWKRNIVITGGSGAGWTLPFISTHLRKLECITTAGQVMDLPTLRLIVTTRDKETISWMEGKLEELKCDSKSYGTISIDIFFTGPILSFRGPSRWSRCRERRKDTEADDGHTKQAFGTLSATTTLHNIHHHDSRPVLAEILDIETNVHQQIGVYVCGPLSMQADVANAIARKQARAVRNGDRDVYLHMEHFSWA